MKPVGVGLLSVVAVVAALLVGCGSAIVVITGGFPPLIAPAVGVVFLVLDVLIWWLGFHVRRYRNGKRTWVTAFAAMRIAALARASAWAGAGFGGALLGIAGASLLRIDAATMTYNAWVAGLGGLAAFSWCVISVVVERWCVLGSDDTDSGDDQRNSTVSAA
ncbi:DUF3180 family protein [Schaalia sp. ZJ1691]|uniref:DUF3180 family protein n=1 Tax=Schaalia sp. ZJ1691 TaxID=2709404 RepID=UPI0013EC4500|nr:DUF3180 family protein [Schaalia sp. ZJ1691]